LASTFSPMPIEGGASPHFNSFGAITLASPDWAGFAAEAPADTAHSAAASRKARRTFPQRAYAPTPEPRNVAKPVTVEQGATVP
jgi:hypothetical protein